MSDVGYQPPNRNRRMAGMIDPDGQAIRDSLDSTPVNRAPKMLDYNTAFDQQQAANSAKPELPEPKSDVGLVGKTLGYLGSGIAGAPHDTTVTNPNSDVPQIEHHSGNPLDVSGDRAAQSWGDAAYNTVKPLLPQNLPHTLYDLSPFGLNDQIRDTHDAFANNPHALETQQGSQEMAARGAGVALNTMALSGIAGGALSSETSNAVGAFGAHLQDGYIVRKSGNDYVVHRDLGRVDPTAPESHPGLLGRPIGRAARHEPDQNYVDYLDVNERQRGKGAATAMYDGIKADRGELVPSGSLTDDGYAFWSKRDPESVSNYVNSMSGNYAPIEDVVKQMPLLKNHIDRYEFMGASPTALAPMKERLQQLEGFAQSHSPNILSSNPSDSKTAAIAQVIQEALNPLSKKDRSMAYDAISEHSYGSPYARDAFDKMQNSTYRGKTFTRDFGANPFDNKDAIHSALDTIDRHVKEHLEPQPHSGSYYRTIAADDGRPQEQWPVFGSSDPNVSASYALDKNGSPWDPASTPSMRRLDAQFKNSLVVDAERQRLEHSTIPVGAGQFGINDLQTWAKDNGYDGLVVKNAVDTMDRSSGNTPSTIAAGLKPETFRNSISGETLFSNGSDSKTAAASAALERAVGKDPPNGFDVWQGSPHDFAPSPGQHFDSSKIGTGEGAQAFGHGLYFAEKENVAKSYSSNYDTDSIVAHLDGKPVDFRDYANNLPKITAHDLLANRNNYDVAIQKAQDLHQEFKNLSDQHKSVWHWPWETEKKRESGDLADRFGRSAKTYADANSYLQGLKDSGAKSEYKVPDRGYIYQTKINADKNSFIPLDKQLAEIDPAISAKLPEEVKQNWDIRNKNGSPKRPINKDEADALAKAGIPGLKYFDNVSRSKGDGSYNYVLFDQDLANVLHKWQGDKQLYSNTSDSKTAAASAALNKAIGGDVDGLGYYSQLDRVLGSLKPTDRVTADTLAQRGVKSSELEARGLAGAFTDGSVPVGELQGRAGQPLKLNEVSYKNDDSPLHPDYPHLTTESQWDDAQHQALMRGDEDLHSELQDAWGEWRSGVPDKTKWSAQSLDPSNPTYRESVLHLPEDRVAAIDARLTGLNAEIAQMSGGMSHDIPGQNMPRFQELRAEAKALSDERADLKQGNFRSSHFPEPNIVGHTMSSMNEMPGGGKVHTLDQIQSDWGQNLRDGGVKDEAKIAGLKAQYEAAQSAIAANDWSKIVKAAGWPAGSKISKYSVDQALGLAEGGRLRVGKDVLDRLSHLKMVEAEQRTAEASAVGHPLVNTTDQWTQTTLRHALKQAVDANADHIAVPSGKTVLTYNPGDEHGMEEFYNKIVPKNLGNILNKLDPETKRQYVEQLQTPNGMKGQGFTTFPITDKVREAVKGGMPLFSNGSSPQTAMLMSALASADPVTAALRQRRQQQQAPQ